MVRAIILKKRKTQEVSSLWLSKVQLREVEPTQKPEVCWDGGNSDWCAWLLKQLELGVLERKKLLRERALRISTGVVRSFNWLMNSTCAGQVFFQRTATRTFKSTGHSEGHVVLRELQPAKLERPCWVPWALVETPENLTF